MIRIIGIFTSPPATAARANPSEPPTRFPQRLATRCREKILRITPDLNLRPGDDLSGNGRYRIPTTGTDPNPFVTNNGVFTNLTGVRKEIFAYGFRNCHRISWDVPSNKIIEDDIGLHSWEEVNIIHKGTNYGYAERRNAPSSFSSPARRYQWQNRWPGISFQFPRRRPADRRCGLAAASPRPAYPVMPITATATATRSPAASFIAASSCRAALRKIYFRRHLHGTDFFDFRPRRNDRHRNDRHPHESPLPCMKSKLFSTAPTTRPTIPCSAGCSTSSPRNTISNGWQHEQRVLPGGATVTVRQRRGRAWLMAADGPDIRFALGDDDEIYVLSKSDGMIRKMTTVLAPSSPAHKRGWTMVNSISRGRRFRTRTFTGSNSKTRSSAPTGRT